MKKLLKISAVGLIIFALVTNLYGAMFSFYGIKTNNLEGAVWASSLSTTDYSGTSGGGTSTSGALMHSPQFHTVSCGAMAYSGSTTNHGDASVSYTTDAAGKVTATVSYGTSSTSSYNSSIGARTRQSKSCDGSRWEWCTSTTAEEACNY